jgi:hypothetical protein
MEKPDIAIGQRWRLKNSRYNYSFIINSVGYICGATIFSSTNDDRQIGMTISVQISALRNMPDYFYIGKKYKKKKKTFILCRGCGNKSEWIDGTRKRSYVCLPCRKDAL